MPFPNGWYLATFSHELAPGDVQPLEMLDRQLVAFRTDDGVAHVVDAHCPHMGAHLGHGGEVIDNCIRCPFHHWRYEGASGKCVQIPTADPIPAKARLKKWHVDESSEMVLVWYHDQGAPPSWSVGTLPDSDTPGWSAWARTDWEVKTTIQDISENDADVAHSPIMHDFTDDRPDLEMHADGPVCTWGMKLRPTLSALRLPNWLLPKDLASDITSRRSGLAIGWITQDFALPGGVRLRSQTLATTTPVDHETCVLKMLHRVRDTGIAPLTKLALEGYTHVWQRTVDQDIAIWRHKIYLDKPCASKSDADIMRFRRWARQFYSSDVERQSHAAQ